MCMLSTRLFKRVSASEQIFHVWGDCHVKFLLRIELVVLARFSYTES